MKHLSRMLFVAVLWGFILVPSPGHATNYQDWWWDPTTSGQGINIGHQGNMIGAAWFLYDQTGSDMWVLLVGPLVGNTVSGGLERYTGPPLGTPFNPAQVSATVVGSATLTFTSPSTAVLSYTVNGVPGTLNLTRFTLGPIPIDGVYLGGSVGSRSGCLNPLNNGSFAYGAYYVVVTSGTTITVQEVDASGESCTGVGQYAQNGSKFSASASFSCTTGEGGTWFSNDITFTEDAFVARVTVQHTIGETCLGINRVGGLKIQ